jgi:hypothetical protein
MVDLLGSSKRLEPQPPRKGLLPYPLFALGPLRFTGQRRLRPNQFNLADRVARLDMQAPIYTSPKQAARCRRMSIVFHLRGVMQREATSYRASTGCCPTICLARRSKATETHLQSSTTKPEAEGERASWQLPCVFHISSHFPLPNSPHSYCMYTSLSSMSCIRLGPFKLDQHWISTTSPILLPSFTRCPELPTTIVPTRWCHHDLFPFHSLFGFCAHLPGTSRPMLHDAPFEARASYTLCRLDMILPGEGLTQTRGSRRCRYPASLAVREHTSCPAWAHRPPYGLSFRTK